MALHLHTAIAQANVANAQANGPFLSQEACHDPPLHTANIASKTKFVE